MWVWVFRDKGTELRVKKLKAITQSLRKISACLTATGILGLSVAGQAQATLVPLTPPAGQGPTSYRSVPLAPKTLDNCDLVSTVMLAVARAAEDDGQTIEAMRLYEQVWHLRQARSTATVNGAIAAGRLAFLLTRLGQLSKAEDYAKLSLKDVRTIFGGQGELTGIALNNLATIEEVMHRFSEAEKLYRQSIAATLAEADFSQETLATARTNLANLYCKVRQFDEAINQYTLALKELRRTSSDQDPEVQALQNKLIRVRKHLQR